MGIVVLLSVMLRRVMCRTNKMSSGVVRREDVLGGVMRRGENWLWQVVS